MKIFLVLGVWGFEKEVRFEDKMRIRNQRRDLLGARDMTI